MNARAADPIQVISVARMRLAEQLAVGASLRL
jgi:hypothetical protein